MTKEIIEIYVDGGSRGNPGDAGIGIVIKKGKETIKEISEYIGKATNNVAEYVALNRGLQEAVLCNYHDIAIFADSELMVRQLIGEYKVRDESLRPLNYLALSLIKKFKNQRIFHIPRENNKEADKLLNKAIDGHSSPLFA
ncbi:MAG: ribonuclease HI family protein [bacterium]